MHLVFYLRGINSEVEKWKVLAQGVYWKWIRTNIKTGKKEEVLVQGSLRPSIMGTWEYIFPEECLAEVLAVMGLTSKKLIGIDYTIKNRVRLAGLRKLLGLKKIPLSAIKEAETIPPSLTIKHSWRGLSHLKIFASIHPIGIKKDRRDIAFGYEQEML